MCQTFCVRFTGFSNTIPIFPNLCVEYFEEVVYLLLILCREKQN